jgi:pyocin large subunit-like protein
VPFTKGFDPWLLGDHFTKHAADFGATSEAAYEAMADTFLGSPLAPPTRECIRGISKDIVRYNPVTNEFGVLARNGMIRTYYKPNPRNKVKYPTGLDYFRAECQKP